MTATASKTARLHHAPSASPEKKEKQHAPINQPHDQL